MMCLLLIHAHSFLLGPILYIPHTKGVDHVQNMRVMQHGVADMGRWVNQV